jgi:AcrR family transcriptional regulator
MARPRSISDERLLDAARAVFIEQGAEASTRRVAEVAGVSEAVLFQRFRTKQDLFFAAMMPRPMAVSTVLGELPEAGAAAAMRHLVEIGQVLSVAIQAALPRTLRAALHPAYPKVLETAHQTAGPDSFVDALAERLGRLKARGDLKPGADPHQTAQALVELLHGLALAVALGAIVPGTDAVERAIHVLWRGLAPEEDTQ